MFLFYLYSDSIPMIWDLDFVTTNIYPLAFHSLSPGISHLVKIYVDTINSGSVPCLENAVVAMAEIENQSAMNEGFRLYEQGMGDLSKTFPMDVGTASAEHQRIYAMATKEFLKHSFKDDGGKYMRQLMVSLDKLKNYMKDFRPDKFLHLY